jgi:hypothetical protein
VRSSYSNDLFQRCQRYGLAPHALAVIDGMSLENFIDFLCRFGESLPCADHCEQVLRKHLAAACADRTGSVARSLACMHSQGEGLAIRYLVACAELFLCLSPVC